MKKILLIIAICFTSQICLAQYNTTLVVSPNPPGAILSWSIKDLTYIVSGSAGVAGDVLIKATLKLTDGTVAANTDLVKARPTRINPATGNIFYAADVIPLNVMIFTGKFKASMDRSGKLPAGAYELCVQLVAPVSYQPLSQERCRIFNIASFQLPIPIMPANETILDLNKSKAAITFRWTPVAPQPAELLTYRVTVFEILDYQTPMQALRSNQPLLAKDVMGTTQFIWQPQLGLTQCSLCETGDSISTGNFDAYAFIWTIQTLDSRGVPFGDGNINGDGISEANIFFIDRRPPAKRNDGPPSRINFLKGKKN